MRVFVNSTDRHDGGVFMTPASRVRVRAEVLASRWVQAPISAPREADT